MGRVGVPRRPAGRRPLHNVLTNQLRLEVLRRPEVERRVKLPLLPPPRERPDDDCALGFWAPLPRPFAEPRLRPDFDDELDFGEELGLDAEPLDCWDALDFWDEPDFDAELDLDAGLDFEDAPDFWDERDL